MKTSVSIALFFLLSGFFLAVLLGTLERSRKLLLAAGGCLAAVVCIIVFLTPVEWPSWRLGWDSGSSDAVVGTTSTSAVSTTVSTAVTTGATDAQQP